MKAALYLKEIKPENLVAIVENLEVVPRGIYEIDGKAYQYSGSPKFIIKKGEFRGEFHKLVKVEIIVEEYLEPKVDDPLSLI